MRDSDTNELPSSIIFKEGRLCYCDHGCRIVPEALGRMYGFKTQFLDLSYNELETLKGLDVFTELRELILDNNQLGDSLTLPLLPQLHTLSLNKNLIGDLETLLKQIKDRLPRLTYLSLLGNRACPHQSSNAENDDADYQRYRYFVLYHLPNLKFLDSSRVACEELTEAQRRGRYMKVVTPTNAALGDDIPAACGSRPTNGLKYNPLPKSLRNPDDIKGAYGKCRYRYSGKHSEGNRFISNKDL